MVTAREDLSYTQAREQARDLKRQLTELNDYDSSEITLKETSPARRRYILYSMEDGSEVPVFRYRVDAYLETGRFTSDPSRAPQFTHGKVKCFLAKDSPEREVLNAMGITRVCKAEKLANLWAKEEHARKKHRAEWQSYQHHRAEQERKEWQEQQKAQTAAIMALAQSSGTAPRINTVSVDSANVHPNTELPYDANGVSAVKTCEKCGMHYEGTDTFAKARHMKVCTAKDGE